MNSHLEPLTVTVADARKISRLSNASIYKMINARLVKTTVVMGRRLIVYASLKAALGIRPDGAPPTPLGLGDKIKNPPGRHRKQALNSMEVK